MSSESEYYDATEVSDGEEDNYTNFGKDSPKLSFPVDKDGEGDITGDLKNILTINEGQDQSDSASIINEGMGRVSLDSIDNTSSEELPVTSGGAEEVFQPGPHPPSYSASNVFGKHPLTGLDEGGHGSQLLTVGARTNSNSTTSANDSFTTTADSTSSIAGGSIALSLVPVSSTDDKQQIKSIKVKTRRKIKSEFGNLFLIQELFGTSTATKSLPDGLNAGSRQSDTNLASKETSTIGHPLYCMKFSPDGNFLAVAGEEGIIRIWKLVVDDVLAAMSEDHSYKPIKTSGIFIPSPVFELHGHEAVILDLSWSRNGFLLSASMDRTVRLWHCSRNDCLGVFRHPDFVTSVAFHPKDDRLFMSGSLDCRVRLWSIVEKGVKAWNELPANNFVTAVAFTNSGRYALAGTTTGVCLLFDCDGFTYSTQIHVHSKSGKNRIGKKICGIEPLPGLRGDSGDERILISTNDSRIRLYTLRDKSIICKFIGHENGSSQIKAFLSDDGEFVISGSESNRVYIWSVENRYSKKSLFSKTPREHIKSCEYFEAHSKTVTAAIFAPSQVRHRLQSVGLRPVAPEDTSDSSISAHGYIMVAIDLNGRVKVYENNNLLEEWLNNQ